MPEYRNLVIGAQGKLLWEGGSQDHGNSGCTGVVPTGDKCEARTKQLICVIGCREGGSLTY